MNTHMYTHTHTHTHTRTPLIIRHVIVHQEIHLQLLKLSNDEIFSVAAVDKGWKQCITKEPNLKQRWLPQIQNFDVTHHTHLHVNSNQIQWSHIQLTFSTPSPQHCKLRTSGSELARDLLNTIASDSSATVLVEVLESRFAFMFVFCESYIISGCVSFFRLTYPSALCLHVGFFYHNFLKDLGRQSCVKKWGEYCYLCSSIDLADISGNI